MEEPIRVLEVIYGMNCAVIGWTFITTDILGYRVSVDVNTNSFL